MNQKGYFSETARSENLDQIVFHNSVEMLGTLRSDPSQEMPGSRSYTNQSVLRSQRSSQKAKKDDPNSQQTNAESIERRFSQISGNQAMLLLDNQQKKSNDFVPLARTHRNFVVKRVTTASKARQPDKNSRIQATYNVTLDLPTKARCKSSIRRNNKSNTTQRFLQAEMFLPEIQTHTLMSPSSAFQTVLSPLNKQEYSRNHQVFQNEQEEFSFEQKPLSETGNLSDFHNLKKVTVAPSCCEIRPLQLIPQSPLQSLASKNLKSETQSMYQKKTHVKVAGKNGLEKISIDQVSPELAAQIVKHFILPMFSSDKNKQKFSTKSSGKSSVHDQTIYGDLKLTEQLSENLAQMQVKLNDLQEKLEEKTIYLDQATNRIANLQKKNTCQQKAVWDLKQQLKLSLRNNEGLHKRNLEIYSQIEGLIEIGMLSEQGRQKVSENLQKVMADNEDLKNVVINKGTTERMQRHAIEYLQDQFKILYKAIEHLAIDKREGERLSFKINSLIQEANEKMEQFQGLQIHSTVLTEERDRLLDDVKEMMEVKKMISKDLLIQRFTLKDKIAGLEIALKKKTADFEATVQENFKLMKQNKTLMFERDKSKQRIQKLMQRKGKFDSGIKACKKCNKEYNEKENFNWSCRTHQSEWGGELWWCCGKRGKEMPGCKYSKHESKDEGDDSDEKDSGEPSKYMRCYCCKELGHNIDQCSRDPNLKTGALLASDWDRILRIKDFRKLYADTIVQTTQYLKNAVKIPRIEDDVGDLVEPENTTHPFMRGVMNFDDYNYSTFNQYILKEEPNAEEKRRLRHEQKRLKEIGPNAASKVSEANLNKLVTVNYEHDEIAEPSVVNEKESDKIESIAVSVKKSVSSALSATETETVAKPQESEQDQSENSDSMEDEQDDDFLFKVYYRPDEINKTQSLQARDVFNDIMNLKTDAVSNAQLLGAQSKFNIEDFMPQNPTKNASKVKKQGEKIPEDSKSNWTENQEKQSDETQKQERMTRKLSKLDEKQMLEYLHNYEAAYLKVEIKEIIEETIRTSPTNSQKSLRSDGKGSKKGRAESKETKRRNSKMSFEKDLKGEEKGRAESKRRSSKMTFDVKEDEKSSRSSRKKEKNKK